MTQVSCHDNVDVLSGKLEDATKKWNHKNNSKDDDVKINCTLDYISKSEVTSHSSMKLYFPDLRDVPESNNNPPVTDTSHSSKENNDHDPAASPFKSTQQSESTSAAKKDQVNQGQGMDAVGEVSHLVRIDELRTQSFTYEETSIYRQDLKEKNSDMPNHEHATTDSVTDTSHSANPPCTNEEWHPKVPLPVPVLPVEEMVDPSRQELEKLSLSDHPSRQELEEPSLSDHMSMKKKKKSAPDRDTKSASKLKSTKKRKTSSKSNNSFDVFGDDIDCSEFDKFFDASKVEITRYPWKERRHVRKG